MSPALPVFVAAGEALTDLIRVDGEQWLSKTGGSTWNVARAAARLGLSSAFAGAISQDCFGDALWQESAAAGLDLRFLQRQAKSPLLAIVHETQPPQYFFVGDDAADLHFAPDGLPAGWLQAVRWVHFGGISLARQPLAGKLLAMARQLKAQGVRISYDPNFRVLMDEAYDPTLQAMTSLAEVIKVSDEDLAGLFRTDDLDAAFARLRSYNPGACYLYTRGGAGASLHRGADSASTAVADVAIVDTVGAGDASMAGLAYSLLDNPAAPLAQHLRFAVATGTAACLAAGATPPDQAQVKQVLAQMPGC